MNLLVTSLRIYARGGWLRDPREGESIPWMRDCEKEHVEYRVANKSLCRQFNVRSLAADGVVNAMLQML